MQSKESSKLHIIHGVLKNRLVFFSGSLKARPTSSRVRERVFTWLESYIHKSKCLDLFAGTGALGIEMISRGASHVTFVDHDVDSIKGIKNTAKLLGISPRRYRCISSIFKYKKTTQQTPYNILLIDPPFFELNLSAIVRSLYEKGCIQKGVIIYIESSRCNNIYKVKNVRKWILLKSAITKNTRYSLFLVR